MGLPAQNASVWPHCLTQSAPLPALKLAAQFQAFFSDMRGVPTQVLKWNAPERDSSCPHHELGLLGQIKEICKSLQYAAAKLVKMTAVSAFLNIAISAGTTVH